MIRDGQFDGMTASADAARAHCPAGSYIATWPDRISIMHYLTGRPVRPMAEAGSTAEDAARIVYWARSRRSPLSVLAINFHDLKPAFADALRHGLSRAKRIDRVFQYDGYEVYTRYPKPPTTSPASSPATQP